MRTARAAAAHAVPHYTDHAAAHHARQVDLCDFAESGTYLCFGPYGNNVIVPYEQSPHFTLKFGFMGKTLFVQALIKIGNDDAAPSPYHCQLLKDDRTIVLMQSTNGWTNAKLTSAYFKLQIDCEEVPIGKGKDGNPRPKVLNFDGHSAHMYNEELKELLLAQRRLHLKSDATALAHANL